MVYPSKAQQELVYIADTQAPIWLEQIFLPNENNIKATDALFSNILNKKPSTVFLLGDLVSRGSNDKNWKMIDSFTNKLKDADVEYYAIKGNHEYLFNPKRGIRNFDKRFGPKDVMSVTVDSIATVLINSNYKFLENEEEVLKDYKEIMAALQKSRAVKAIIVCTHHSPFTNSSIVSPSRWVHDNIVPTYIETPKAILFLSGHSHNMEVFKEEGKFFCVVGGGGGLKQKLVNEHRHEDVLVVDEEHFRFFYVTINKEGNSILLYSHGINDHNEEEQFKKILELDIKKKKTIKKKQ